MLSSVVPDPATSTPITRNFTRALRSNSRWPAGTFSSSTNMESPEWFVFDDEIGDRNGLGNRLRRNPPVPLADYFIPTHALLKLFEDKPHHDARAFERRLAAADFRVGHDVAAQLDSMNSTVRLRFHASVVTMRPAEFDYKPTNPDRETASRKAPLSNAMRNASHGQIAPLPALRCFQWNGTLVSPKGERE